MLYNKIPCGKFAGSGASGSKKPSVNKSLIVLNAPAPVFPCADFSAVVPPRSVYSQVSSLIFFCLLWNSHSTVGVEGASRGRPAIGNCRVRCRLD